ncbi:GntR family transcriptional regulator [Candidimonas nitroreducens]|uniref:Transcriptional regulator n=1 Tax=Candidimonas nitroreducens TaxID=683354 RepID=A0A225MRV6_9BURK|nr:GntR family transcriptional regulator [Candidimonas nitroreducens]OWT64067.1 transcriptional regulator [Candidimonas nitroreducens]
MPKKAATQPGLADRIAHDIQSGVHGAGAWLKQIDMQERYGAKRLDVRRALDLLVLKRLIEHIPNRGYHVYAMSERSEDEIRDVRIMLEAGAVPDLIASASAAGIKNLRALAERFAGLLREGTLLEQYEANLAFHAAVYDICSNRELVGLIGDMRGRAPAAPATQWWTRARIEQSAREHFQIVEALEARDAGRLRKVITAHIRQSA